MKMRGMRVDLEALTLRPMALTAPPDETWVIIGYQSAARHWKCTRVASRDSGPFGEQHVVDDPLAMTSEVARLMGFDSKTEAVRRAEIHLFPDEIGKERRMAQAMVAAGAPTVAARAPYRLDRHTQASSVLGYDVKGEALRSVKHAMRFPDLASRTLLAAEAAAQAGAREVHDHEPPARVLRLPHRDNTHGCVRLYPHLLPHDFRCECLCRRVHAHGSAASSEQLDHRRPRQRRREHQRGRATPAGC